MCEYQIEGYHDSNNWQKFPKQSPFLFEDTMAEEVAKDYCLASIKDGAYNRFECVVAFKKSGRRYYIKAEQIIRFYSEELK